MSSRKTAPKIAPKIGSRQNFVRIENLEPRQLLSAATDASDVYIYGLAPVLANITEQIDTSVAAQSNSTGQAPINQFANEQTYPSPTNSVIVRPNADTLYSTAWLNLANGPLVLQTPNTGSNFELFQFLDAYTNTFAGIGTRTTGSGAQSVLIAGPNWTGTVPQGLTLIKTPTNTVWIIGRIAVPQDSNGNPEYAPINALQAQITLEPLANYLGGGTYTPPTNVPITALSSGISASETDDQNVLGLTAQQYFTLLSQALKVNPPPASDNAIISELAEFNLGPGQHFNWSTLTAAQQTALSTGLLLGEQRLVADGKNGVGVTEVTSTNWTERLQDGEIGDYGTNYDARAVIAYGGLGANLPEDAIYPSTSVDSNGNALTGANNYEITFPAGELPPAGAFWSLTVYNSSGYFVSNPISRYSIGSLDSGLVYNADGSLTIYLQNTAPASGDSNWLPTPTGAFNVTLRVYDPAASALNGTWIPPAIETDQQVALNAAAVSAYQYLYPLVNQYYTEQQQTDVSSPDGDTSQAPINQLFNNSLAPLENNTGPNADTLYTGGWLDLSDGPIVLHVPNFNGRYYSVELADAWTNTFSIIGTPTTGTAAGDYAIVGPGWSGTLPQGVTEIQAPTNLVELLGRTLVYGASDLNTADSYRQQFSLTPLADYGTSYTPPADVPVNPDVDTTDPVARQIAGLTGPQFFALAAQLLQTNPPLAADSGTGILTTLSELGLTPGQTFNPSSLSQGQLAAVNQSSAAGTAQVGADAYTFERSGSVYGTWYGLPSDIADFGTNYADRAGAAYTGVFVLTNPPAEALYLSAVTDGYGNPLNGSNDYELTFPAGQLPPAQYFWSVTLYQSDGELYPNSYNTYQVDSFSPYQLNPDGSLTLYIGNTPPPAGLQSNWIPAPADAAFTLTIRIYGPEGAAVNGTYIPPSVFQANYGVAAPAVVAPVSDDLSGTTTTDAVTSDLLDPTGSGNLLQS
jgi:hypothetical protein